MSNTAQAEARKPEVRPARVWQPTDLLHPIAPAGGFLPNPWQPAQSAGFDPQGFVTPVLDLQAMAREAAAKAAAAQANKLEAARAANSADDASQDGADAISQDDPSDTASAAPGGDDAHTRPDSDTSDDASVPDPSTAAPSDLIAPATPAIDAQAVEQARAQGHAQGMAEASAQLQAQAKAQAQAELAKDTALLDKLQVALDDLQQHPQSFFEPLKRLSLHLAEQLVLAELQLDGSAIERLVQRCVDDLGQHDESMVTVNLHPSDVERLHSMRERTGLNEGSSLRLQADETLLPGSVRASANDAIVEDLIAERLSTLARGLHIDEPRWSAQSAFSAARIAADRVPSGRVEDAQPRMAAAPSAAVAASHSPAVRAVAADSIDGADDAPRPVHAPSGYDTVAAIDEILNDENHV
jgi:flagellar biosynthesis/type III secretory pathway protein FliH